MMKSFTNRARPLLAALSIWAVVLAFRLFYFTVFAQSRLQDKGDLLAWRRGRVPAARGDVLDANGAVLAWTERHFDLVLNGSMDDPERRDALMAALQEALSYAPRTLDRDDRGWIVKESLSPDELTKLKPALTKFDELAVVPRLRRAYVDYPKVRVIVGVASGTDGALRGESGVEKRFDRVLAGRDGRYRVMLDRRGRWIPGTFVLEKPAVPGDSVRLDSSVEQINAEVVE